MNAKLLRCLGRSGIVLAAVISLSNCASPIENRIASNPTLYEKLSPSDKALVSQGRLREGMTKESVFLAWGRPDRVAQGRSHGSSIEKWTYIGQRPVHTQTFGLGLGFGHYGYGYGYGGAWDPLWMGGGPS